MSTDRRSDQESRDRIDELGDAITKRLDAIAAAYSRHNRKVTWILAGVVLILLVGGAAFSYQLGVNEDAGKRNQQGIKVGCTLLTNAIVESGAAGGSNTRRTELFIVAARRSMTPTERAEFDKLGPPAPPAVEIPDCEKISKHPDSVHARPLPQPKKK